MPPDEQVRLRPFEPADAPATWEVFHAAVRRTALSRYSPAQVAAWSPDEVDRERWAGRRAAAWTVVALDGHRVVGFADLTGDVPDNRLDDQVLANAHLHLDLHR